MQVYPGDPAPRVRQVSAVESDGFWLHEVVIGSQTGTHVDAPAHVLNGAGDTGTIAVEDLVATAHIVDLSACGDREIVGVDRLSDVLGRCRPGDAVLLRFGWDRFDGDQRAWSHPGLAEAAAHALVAAEISFIGTDAASIDCHDSEVLAAHHVFASAGVPIVENLAHLDEVTWPEPLVVVGMLPFAHLDGAPARVLALDVESGPR
mgnify:FL=1